MIELVIDFVSVNAYLAVHPAKQLADELDVELKLTPLRTTSELNFVADEKPNETVGERHRRVRATYTRMDAERYAEVQGLPFEIDGRDIESELALKGLLAANANQVGFEYASEMFKSYWSGKTTLNDIGDVRSVLASVGVGEFNESDSRWDLALVRADAEERGVFAVPLFIVKGEKYMGRQHLPMIRWQLSEFAGQGPL